MTENKPLNEYKQNILRYKISVQTILDWFKSGWINKTEFNEMDKMLAEIYGIPENSIFLEHEWLDREINNEKSNKD